MNNYKLSFFVLSLVLFFASCTSNDIDTLVLPTHRTVTPIDSILPDTLLDVIDPLIIGDDPPSVEGVYYLYQINRVTQGSTPYPFGGLYIKLSNQTIDNKVSIAAIISKPSSSDYYWMTKEDPATEVYIKGNNNSFATYYNDFPLGEAKKGPVYIAGNIVEYNDNGEVKQGIQNFIFYYQYTNVNNITIQEKYIPNSPDDIAISIDESKWYEIRSKIQ